MFNVAIKNLGRLRDKGYHFIENEEGDTLRIFDAKGHKIYEMKVDDAGLLQVRDNKGEEFWCESLEISMRLAGDLCIAL